MPHRRTARQRQPPRRRRQPKKAQRRGRGACPCDVVRGQFVEVCQVDALVLEASRGIVVVACEYLCAKYGVLQFLNFRVIE